MARYVILGLIAAGAAAAASVGLAQPAPPSAPAPPPPAPAATPTPPPPPATPPAPPAAPPAAIGPYLISALDKVCTPLIQGQKVKDVAKANGLRHFHGAWLLQGPGVERVIITPPSIANPTICEMTVNYEVGQTPGVVTVLSGWAAAQNPPMAVLASGVARGEGVTGWSWEFDNGSSHEGLVFDHQSGADGKPAGRDFEVGTMLFSLKKG